MATQQTALPRWHSRAGLTQGSFASLAEAKGTHSVVGSKLQKVTSVVMLDADGSARPEEIPAFVDALLAGADFAKGSRFAPGGGSADITPLRRAGNAVLGSMVNGLYGTHYTDLCYGYNAFWRRCLPVLALDGDGFEVETMINIRAAKAGLHVTEVPSFEDARIHGNSKLHTFRDGWRVLATILRERWRPSDRVGGHEDLASPAEPAIAMVTEEATTDHLLEDLPTRVRQHR